MTDFELIEKWDLCRTIMKGKKISYTFGGGRIFLPFYGYFDTIDELYTFLETKV